VSRNLDNGSEGDPGKGGGLGIGFAGSAFINPERSPGLPGNGGGGADTFSRGSKLIGTGRDIFGNSGR